MIPAGVRQGAKMGSWLLVIMINDLRVTNADLWKYVDFESPLQEASVVFLVFI